MKKLIAIALVLTMVMALAACGNKTEDPGALEITLAATEPEAEAAGEVKLQFVYEGVTLVPGQAFDHNDLPEYDSLYTVPSCAIEGTDNVYNYGGFEVTAFDLGEGEHIYSVYLIDNSVATPEGLKVGDTADKVVELYGSDYQDNDGEYVYTQGEVMLAILFEGESVVSIEYLMVV